MTAPPSTEPPSAPRAGAARRGGASLLICLVFATYPVLAWLGSSLHSPRAVALLLLALVLPAAWWAAKRGRGNAARVLLLGPVVTSLALAAAALFGSTQLLYVEPVVINLSLLLLFGSTLRPGSMPMIERFARLQESHLSPAQLAWCRLWTWIWTAFFAVNGATAQTLALVAPMSWWAWYNTVLANVCIGVLIGTEWSIRRWRFHR